MSIKQIASCSHNWSHSFTSKLNIVRNESVAWELRTYAEALNGARLVFHWLPEECHDPSVPQLLTDAFESYLSGLPGHLKASNVGEQELTELRTEVWFLSGQFCVEAIAVDVQGNEHRQMVHHSY